MNGKIIEGAGRRRFVLAVVGSLVVGAAAVFLFSLRGSSDSADNQPRPRRSVEGTVSTPKTPPPGATKPPTSPTLPSNALEETAPGAAAFARYFFDVYNYSFSSLNTDLLARLSAPECRFCASAVRNVTGISDIDGRAIAGRIVVSEAVAAPGPAEDGVLVNLLINQEAGTVVDGRGVPVSTVAPSTNRRIDVQVRWRNGSWQVFEVDAKPAS